MHNCTPLPFCFICKTLAEMWFIFYKFHWFSWVPVFLGDSVSCTLTPNHSPSLTLPPWLPHDNDTSDDISLLGLAFNLSQTLQFPSTPFPTSFWPKRRRSFTRRPKGIRQLWKKSECFQKKKKNIKKKFNPPPPKKEEKEIFLPAVYSYCGKIPP